MRFAAIGLWSNISGGPAERLVKAAFRAVAGETASQERIAKVREILERAICDLDGMRDKPSP